MTLAQRLSRLITLDLTRRPSPEELKREAIRACTVAEGVLHRARRAGDTRAIHVAQIAYTEAKTNLLSAELRAAVKP
jgi:hypothetical protein